MWRASRRPRPATHSPWSRRCARRAGSEAHGARRAAPRRRADRAAVRRSPGGAAAGHAHHPRAHRREHLRRHRRALRHARAARPGREALLAAERDGVLEIDGTRATFTHPLLRSLVHRRTEPRRAASITPRWPPPTCSRRTSAPGTPPGAATEADETTAARLDACAERFLARKRAARRRAGPRARRGSQSGARHARRPSAAGGAVRPLRRPCRLG